MANQIDIKTLSVIEIKALLWDLQNSYLQTQKNIQLLTKELEERNVVQSS